MRVPLYKRLFFWSVVAIVIGILFWMVATANEGGPLWGGLVFVLFLIMAVLVVPHLNAMRK